MLPSSFKSTLSVTVVATIEPYEVEPGFFAGYVDLETTQRDGTPDGPRFRVPITAMIEQNLFTAPRSLGFRSKYVQRARILPPGRTDPAGFVSALHSVARQDCVDLVVPVTDDAIHPLLAARERFAGWTELALAWALDQDQLHPHDVTDPRINPNGTPGWAILNLNVGGAIDRHSGWRVGLLNILDTYYRVHGSGIDAPGITLVLELTLIAPLDFPPVRLRGEVVRHLTDERGRAMGVRIDFADDGERVQFSRLVRDLERAFLGGTLPEEFVDSY